MFDALPAGSDTLIRDDRLTSLDALPPGLFAYAKLHTFKDERLEPRDLVRAMQGHARQAAFHQAHVLESLSLIVDQYLALGYDMELAIGSAESEARAALNLTRRAARIEVELACELIHRLPEVLSALRAGIIDRLRARVIVDACIVLPDEEASLAANEALTRAGGLTTGELRSWMRRLCMETNPKEAQDRFQQATEERSVWAELAADGTGTITATGLAPDRMAAAMNRATEIAHHLKTANEPRSIDQLRADVFLELLEGSAEHAHRKGVIHIRTELTTLMNLDERAVELSGYGPVVADIARQVAERGVTSSNAEGFDRTEGGEKTGRPNKAEWRFTVRDMTGTALTGLTRRRPSAEVKRIVESTDVTCIFPGYRTPSTNCDLDHRIPFSAGGLTHADQLAPLCRHDHVIRHQEWVHSPNGDGTHTWTSPLGIIYTTARAP